MTSSPRQAAWLCILTLGLLSTPVVAGTQGVGVAAPAIARRHCTHPLSPAALPGRPRSPLPPVPGLSGQ